MGSSGALWHYLGSFIFYTFAAIGVLYGAYWYLKKNPGLLTFTKSRLPSKESLLVESCLPLEARKNIYVVRAGKERFLLATSPEGTQFLSRLEAAEEPATLTEVPTEVPTSTEVTSRPLSQVSSFLTALQQIPALQEGLKTFRWAVTKTAHVLLPKQEV